MSIVDFMVLETPRLRLRRFEDGDLSVFMAYRNDPEVARYQSWEGISASEADAFIQEQKAIKPGKPGEWFQIAFELKETGLLIGDCGFSIKQQDNRQAEIGYTLARTYQRQGFATEAITHFLTYAFHVFHLHRVVAEVDCENIASVALLERLGMRREGHFIQDLWFKGQWASNYLYAILRTEWLSKHNIIP